MKGNLQQEVSVHRFVRVLDRLPHVRHESCEIYDRLGLFVETFGPPEIRKRRTSAMLFWNFHRNDGTRNFSLISCVPKAHKPTASIGRMEVEVRLVAQSGEKSFLLWALDRLAAIENGDEPPAFLGGAHFTVTPMQ